MLSLHAPLFSVSLCRPLTVMLYLLFLFLVVIILLNVLIAQVSETYAAVQSTARASFLFHRSRFITRCEESTALWFLLWTFRWRKIGSSCGVGCDVESQANADQNHPKVGSQSICYTYIVHINAFSFVCLFCVITTMAIE